MTNPDRHQVWSAYKVIAAQQEELEHLKSKLSGDVYELKNDIENKIEIMRQLDYIDNECLLKLKGSTISNVENPMDIVIVESLFSGVLSNIEVNEIPPVISLFVSESVAKLDRRYVNEGVVNAVSAVRKVANSIQALEKDKKVETLIGSLRKGLCGAIYKWACGESFIEITKITHEREGNIVRAIQRTNEMIGTLCMCADEIGDFELKERLEAARQSIQRSIVFAASLYLE